MILLLLALAAGSPYAAEHGFNPARFKQWVEMRVGRGKPVYWYGVGTVFSWPTGKPLMRIEGVAGRLDLSLSTPTMAHQLSRKTFVYRDLDSNAILTSWNGQPLRPIDYPYQVITYKLQGDGMPIWVEQGSGARMPRIGPTVMHMVAWRLDRYRDLPANMREHLERDGKVWREPPRDLAEIRALQRQR